MRTVDDLIGTLINLSTAAAPTPPATPSLPSTKPVAPILNRGAYTADGDNTNGDWAHVQQIARQLWHQYGGIFGPGAAPPPIAFDQSISDPARAWAEAYPVGLFGPNNPRSGAIVFSPSAINAIAHSNDPSHDYGLEVIAHETAHTFQSPATYASGLSEGGADAFGRTVGKQAVGAAGLTNRGTVGRGAAPYDALTDRAFKRGMPWITGGQFAGSQTYHGNAQPPALDPVSGLAPGRGKR